MIPALAQSFLDDTTVLFQYTIHLPPWAVIAILAVAGFLFHFVLQTLLRRGAKRTAAALDDVLVEISARAVPFWIFLSILFVLLEMTGPGRERLQAVGNAVVGVLFLVSLFWSASSLLLRAMEIWSARNAAFQPLHPPVRFVLKAVMIVVGTVTVLAYAGVQVGPILATLGVGGLAVALALRDTLENFFAGLHIMADRPLSEGDTILVHETGSTGTVLKVGWRSTRIRTSENNILVVPNVKLASGIVTNLSLQDSAIHVRVQVGVSYDSDPDRVREVLLDTARSLAGKGSGVAASPEPEAWLHPGFGPASLDFTVRVTAEGPDRGTDAQDALRRAIYRRLKAEGIAIPVAATVVPAAATPRS